MDSLIEQANSFGLMVVAGLLSGLLFDLFRVIRGRLFSCGKIGTFFWDLLYCLCAAAVIYAFMIVGSWGELRFYLLAGAMVGIAFYFLVFSRAVIRVLVWLTRAIGRLSQAMGVSTRNLFYQGVNFSVWLGRKTGLSKIIRRGRTKVGALQQKVDQLKPKFRVPSRPKRETVEVKRAKKPAMGKRFHRAARIFSARSRNILRGLGRGFTAKR